MKRESLKTHLRPYSILLRRKTTINHAFASAIALNADYDDRVVMEALEALGQNPDADLVCAYCDKNPAETRDHVVGLVKGQKYSGYGHNIGNLLPCCKQCNSSKGNKDWRTFVIAHIGDEERRAAKLAQLERYFCQYLVGAQLGQDEISQLCPDEMAKLDQLRNAVLSIMKEADETAASVRAKVTNRLAVP